MFNRISYTWSLIGASWNVLKKDKSILIFPLLSAICCLIVIASFAYPIILTKSYVPPRGEGLVAQKVIYYGTLFLFYFANYFVITFFNTALVSCAIARMTGGEPTVGGGFREAMSRIHLIVGWALVAATVGLVLKVIGEKSGKVGQFVTEILGAGWSIITYLVVPVLVVENKGPIAAVQESGRLLKKTWGEQITGQFSFGLIFGLLAIPAFIGIIAGAVSLASHNAVFGISLIGLGVVYFIALSLIHSALQSIFQAAVYLYTQNALDSRSPQGFPVQLIQGAIA